MSLVAANGTRNEELALKTEPLLEGLASEGFNGDDLGNYSAFLPTLEASQTVGK